MKIHSKRQYEQFKVYFNGILHLHLKLNDLIGFQSWIHGESEYYIEYYFSNGGKITTAYGEKEKWESILKIIDKEISVIG